MTTIAFWAVAVSCLTAIVPCSCAAAELQEPVGDKSIAQSCMFCTFYAACTSFRKNKIPSRIK